MLLSMSLGILTLGKVNYDKSILRLPYFLETQAIQWRT